MPNRKSYSMSVDATSRHGEINLYGEVHENRPRDFWTGRPVEGQMIILSEFLDDLDKLTGYDELDVHINSVGGDFFAGLAIYNRLKGLGCKVTTINDSLAASAGSIIMQAGDVRKVRKASSMMVHCAAGFMFGWYNAADLDEVSKQLQHINDVAATAYNEAGVESTDKALADMEAETWMTGEEAVAAGYADEVIEDGEELGVSMAVDRSYMTAGGHRICAAWMPDELPEGIEIIDALSPENPVEDILNEEGTEEMNPTTIDELRAAFPELCAQLVEAERASATAAERERMRALDELCANITDRELINAARYGENPMSAEQLAVEAIRRGAVGNAAMLDAIDSDARESGADSVTAAYDAKLPTEPEAQEQGGISDDVIAAVNARHKND